MSSDNETVNSGSIALVDSRLIGVSRDGIPINNVGPHNRFDVNPEKPTVLVHLIDELALGEVLHRVTIPNTREMPDVIRYRGSIYDVVDSSLDPPIYRLCFCAEASSLDNGEIDES